MTVVVRGLHVRGADRQSLQDDINGCWFTLKSNEAWTYVPPDLHVCISSCTCFKREYKLPLLQSSLDSPAFLLEESLPSARRVAPEPRLP